MHKIVFKDFSIEIFIQFLDRKNYFDVYERKNMDIRTENFQRLLTADSVERNDIAICASPLPSSHSGSESIALPR